MYAPTCNDAFPMRCFAMAALSTTRRRVAESDRFLTDIVQLRAVRFPRHLGLAYSTHDRLQLYYVLYSLSKYVHRIPTSYIQLTVRSSSMCNAGHPICSLS